MPRVGSHQSGFHGLSVTDLTHQNDIGVLPENMTQALAKGEGIHTYLTLIDTRHLIAVEVFDRIFNGDDVFGLLIVDRVDHGSEGGRLSDSGRTGHDYQTTRLKRLFVDRLRKSEFVHVPPSDPSGTAGLPLTRLQRAAAIVVETTVKEIGNIHLGDVLS